MLEITRAKPLVVKIYDVEYEIKRPTIRQVNELQDSMKNAKDSKESIEALCSFFESLGLKRDVVLDLDVESLTKLSEFVSGSSEKKS